MPNIYARVHVLNRLFPGYISNSNANWDGEEVVKRSNKSIVFVNFNYRVGLFGFLAGEQVKKDGDLNTGLLDQRLLMDWIQKHISKVIPRFLAIDVLPERTNLTCGPFSSSAGIPTTLLSQASRPAPDRPRSNWLRMAVVTISCLPGLSWSPCSSPPSRIFPISSGSSTAW